MEHLKVQKTFNWSKDNTVTGHRINGHRPSHKTTKLIAWKR